MWKGWCGLIITGHTCIIGECVPVAQLVEQWSPKPPVGGSNPSRPAILRLREAQEIILVHAPE
jgi:hypothetical protein